MTTKFPNAVGRENQDPYLARDSNKEYPEYQHYYYTTICGKTD